MHKIRAMIQMRADKIRQMEQNFEPSQRIQAYKASSLQVIKQDYLARVQELQAANKAQMDRIADEYKKKRPSVREQADTLTVLKTRYRAQTSKQLERVMDTLMKMPPGVLDVEEYTALAAEFRDRGLGQQADQLAGFTSVQRLHEPHVHDETYRQLGKVTEKLKVYEAQAGKIMVLSPDPEKIGKDDIVSLEHIDDKVTS